MKITIGFAFHGQQKYSEKFLNSVLRSNLDGIDYEIVIVGNACPNNSHINLKNQYTDKFKNFKIVENNTNRGCAGGWNDIIRNSSGEYVFICNNDVVFHPECIKNIVEFLDREKDIHIVSPTILERWNTENDYEDHIAYKKMDKFYDENKENLITAWSIIAGCIRRSVFDENMVGEFDENFKLAFYEDCDFGNRTKIKGIYGAALGNAVCHHYGSKTVRQGNSNSKDNSAYFQKKYPDGFIPGKSIEKFEKSYGTFPDNIWKFVPIVNADKIEV